MQCIATIPMARRLKGPTCNIRRDREHQPNDKVEMVESQSHIVKYY